MGIPLTAFFRKQLVETEAGANCGRVTTLSEPVECKHFCPPTDANEL